MASGCSSDGGSGLAPDIRFNVAPAEAMEFHSAKSAKGAILYVPGTSPDSEPDPKTNHVPQYLRTLNGHGWDVFRVNLNYFDQRSVYQNAVARQIMATARTWREEKAYKRVVIAGQSWGGWNPILALKLKPEDQSIYAILASTPAAYTATRYSFYNDNTYQNASKLYELLEEIPTHTRIGLFFFARDEWALERRGPKSSEILAKRGIQNLVLDDPPGVEGHSGAWQPAFNHYYAKCVIDFLNPENQTDAVTCPNASLSPTDHNWMTKEAQLIKGSADQTDELEFIGEFAGNFAVLSNRAGLLSYLKFKSDGTFTGTISRGRPIGGKWFFHKEELCFHGRSSDGANCYRVHAWPNGTHFLVDRETGDILFRFKRLRNGRVFKNGERPTF